MVLQLIVHSEVHLLDSMEKVHDFFCLLFLALFVVMHHTKEMHSGKWENDIYPAVLYVLLHVALKTLKNDNIRAGSLFTTERISTTIDNLLLLDWTGSIPKYLYTSLHPNMRM